MTGEAPVDPKVYAQTPLKDGHGRREISDREITKAARYIDGGSKPIPAELRERMRGQHAWIENDVIALLKM